MSSSAPDDDALRRQFYGARDIRNLYPRITENHLRYLEKWGLIRPAPARGDRATSTFTDVATIKQLAAELDRDVPLQEGAARRCSPSTRGSCSSTSTPRSARRRRSSRCRRRTSGDRRPIAPAPPIAAGNAFPFSDPQAALAAKYFIEGSRLDDGDERKMEEAAAAYRKALVIDPELVPAIVNLANIHYAQRRADRGAGALRARHRRSTRTASRRTSISATSTTISAATTTRWSAIATPSRSIPATPTRTSTWR